MDYELLRPSGTVMVCACVVCIPSDHRSIWKNKVYCTSQHYFCAVGQEPEMEFSTFLSASRIVVFSVFVAGYLWKSEYTAVIRKFKGKIVVALFVIILLFVATNYMIGNNIPVDLFRRQSFLSCKWNGQCAGNGSRRNDVSDSFTVIFALLVLMPDKRHPFIFLGKKHNGNLLFPLSHHDSDERTYDPEYFVADECMGVIWSQFCLY